jgi:hypothetical protein
MNVRVDVDVNVNVNVNVRCIFKNVFASNFLKEANEKKKAK